MGSQLAIGGHADLDIRPIRPDCPSVQRPGLEAVAAPPDGHVPPLATDRLAQLARSLAPAQPPGERHARGVALATTPAGAAAIAAGRHQIRSVDGATLTYPSQDLAAIESSRPDLPGQTHTLARHVGTTLQQDVARLRGSHLRAAGSYDSVAAAQFATDRTVANPRNQAAIGAFLADGGRLKLALSRVDLGRAVGAAALRRDLAAGDPHLVPEATATVVLIKDGTFPEGYRILTTFPDLGRPEVDARGRRLS